MLGMSVIQNRVGSLKNEVLFSALPLAGWQHHHTVIYTLYWLWCFTILKKENLNKWRKNLAHLQKGRKKKLNPSKLKGKKKFFKIPLPRRKPSPQTILKLAAEEMLNAQKMDLNWFYLNSVNWKIICSGILNTCFCVVREKEETPL